MKFRGELQEMEKDPPHRPEKARISDPIQKSAPLLKTHLLCRMIAQLCLSYLAPLEHFALLSSCPGDDDGYCSRKFYFGPSIDHPAPMDPKTIVQISAPIEKSLRKPAEGLSHECLHLSMSQHFFRHVCVFHYGPHAANDKWQSASQATKEKYRFRDDFYMDFDPTFIDELERNYRGPSW